MSATRSGGCSWPAPFMGSATSVASFHHCLGSMFPSSKPSQFSERVADTYAGGEALPRMARVLAEGTGAERADVWLRAGATLRLSASWPDRAGAEVPLVVRDQVMPEVPGVDRAVAVRHQGE